LIDVVLLKNFGTTISPWIVTLDALEPFRVEQPKQDPTPLDYLRYTKDQKGGGFDITLEVFLRTPSLQEPFKISTSNFKYLYWAMRQQLAHHSITGCNMQAGDLCGSGTISGPTTESMGSLLELTWRGTKPITLPNNEVRKFIEDGDTIEFNAFAQGEGYRVGFGSCAGTILPALQ